MKSNKYLCIQMINSYIATSKTTAAVTPTKPLSDDSPGIKHDFEAKVSLSLTQGSPAVPYNTTKFCWFYVTMLEFQIHAGAHSAWS